MSVPAQILDSLVFQPGSESDFVSASASVAVHRGRPAESAVLPV